MIKRCDRCGTPLPRGALHCPDCAALEPGDRTGPVQLPEASQRAPFDTSVQTLPMDEPVPLDDSDLEEIDEVPGDTDRTASPGDDTEETPATEGELRVRGDPLTGTNTVHGVRVRFVGRRRELATLLDLVDELRNGQGASAALLAPPGVGKTRLLWELAVRLGRDRSAPHLTMVTCRTEGRPLPYEPFRRALRAMLHIETGRAPEVAQRNLEAHADMWPVPHTERREAIELVGRLLGISTGSGEPAHPNAPGTPRRGADPSRLAWAVGTLMAADAQHRPLLLALDDADEADDGTAALAAGVLRALRTSPAVVLVLARHLDGPLAEYSFDHRIALSPLTPQESRQLVETVLQRVKAPPKVLHSMILDRAEGNPFAVEELVRLLIEKGAIDTTTDPWLVNQPQLEDAADDLPSNVDDMVRVRVATLSQEERETLRKAAVFGEVFPDGAIAMIDLLEGRPVHDLELFGEKDRAELDSVLASLARKDLLVARKRVGAEREFAFKFPGVRRRIYESIDETRLRRYHYLIAQWMGARVGAGGIDAEAVAEHFEEAAQLREAARYYIRAGDRARSAGALERALDFFGRALELLDHDDVAPRHRALRALGEIQVLLGQNEDANRAFRATLRAAAALGDRAAAGAALQALGRLQTHVGDYGRAQRYLDRACELLTSAGDAPGLAEALDARASLAMLRGSYRAVDEALADRRRSLQIRRSHGAEDSLQIARSLVGVGELLTARGALRAAEESYREARELLRRTEHTGELTRALEGLANVHAETGRWELVLPLVSEALQLAEQLGDRRRKGSLLTTMGRGHLKLGHTGDAVAALNEAVELLTALGDRFAIGEAQRALAEAYTQLDEHRRAEDLCEDAVRSARELGSQLSLGRSLRALGDALSSEIYSDQKGTDPHPRRIRANEMYRRAIAIFEEMGHELELAKSYVEYGRYLAEGGEPKKGSEYLERGDDIRKRAEAGASQAFLPSLTPMPPRGRRS